MATTLKKNEKGRCGPVRIGLSNAFELFCVQVYLKELLSLANEQKRLKEYEKPLSKKGCFGVFWSRISDGAAESPTKNKP